MRMLTEEPWPESEGLTVEAVTQDPFDWGSPGQGFPHPTVGKTTIGISTSDSMQSKGDNRSEPM